MKIKPNSCTKGKNSGFRCLISFFEAVGVSFDVWGIGILASGWKIKPSETFLYIYIGWLISILICWWIIQWLIIETSQNKDKTSQNKDGTDGQPQ